MSKKTEASVGASLGRRLQQLKLAETIEHQAPDSDPSRWTQSIPGVAHLANLSAKAHAIGTVQNTIDLTKDVPGYGDDALDHKLRGQLTRNRDMIDDPIATALTPTNYLEFLALVAATAGATNASEADKARISRSMAELLNRNEALLDAAIAGAQSPQDRANILLARSDYHAVRESARATHAGAGDTKAATAAAVLAGVMPMLPAVAIGVLTRGMDLSPLVFRSMLVLGIVAGTTVGQHVQARQREAFANGPGVRSVERPETNNELVRIHDLISNPHLAEGEPEVVFQKIAVTHTAIEAILDLRKKALGDSKRPVTAEESRIEAAYAAASQKLADLYGRMQSNDPGPWREDLVAVQAELKSAVSRKSIKPETAAGIRPADVLTRDEFRVAVNNLMLGIVRAGTRDYNAPLDRVLSEIGEKVAVSDHLDDQAAKPVSDVDLQRLKMFLSPTPNLAECMAIAPLVRAGALNVEQVWPNTKDIVLPNGEKFDAKTMVNALGELQRFSHGKLEEKVGNGVITFSKYAVSPIAFSAIMLAFPVVGWFWALIGSMVPTIAGYKLGAHLAERGREKHVMTGLELIGGQPKTAESEVILQRLARPDALLDATDGAALKARFATEAQAIRDSLAAEKKFFNPSNADPSQNKDIAHVAPLWVALEKFAARLDQLSTVRTADLNELKQLFLRSRSEVFTQGNCESVQRFVADQLRSSVIESDPRTTLIAMKRDFVNALANATVNHPQLKGAPLAQVHAYFQQEKIVPARIVVDGRGTKLFELAKKVLDAQAAFDQRFGSFRLWSWARSAIAGDNHAPTPKLDAAVQRCYTHPFEPIALGDLMAPLATSQRTGEYVEVEQMAKEHRDNWPVYEKTVASSSTGFIELLTRRALSLYAWPQGADGGEPRATVKNLDVKVVDPKAKADAKEYEVTAELDFSNTRVPRAGRGEVSFTVDGKGYVKSETVKMDVGAAAAAEIGIAAVENHLRALRGSAAGLKLGLESVKKLDRENAYEVVARDNATRYTLKVNTAGGPSLATLKLEAAAPRRDSESIWDGFGYLGGF